MKLSGKTEKLGRKWPSMEFVILHDTPEKKENKKKENLIRHLNVKKKGKSLFNFHAKKAKSKKFSTVVLP